MLSDLLKKGLVEKPVYFTQRTLPLHAMVASVGYSRVTSTMYDWHGLHRGKTEFVLFQYVLSGWGRLRYEGRDITINPGEAMLLHFPHDNRYWLPPESTGWEFIYVCLYGIEIMRLWQELERSCGPVCRLGRDSVPVTTAALIIDKIAYGDDATPAQTSQLAYRLTMELIDLLVTPDITSAPDTLLLNIDRAVSFCRDNLAKAISVDDIAAAAGYSRYHFTRLFTKIAGTAPKEYLQRLRIKKATALLLSTGKSIKQIAVESGFSDANYFCRAFRKIMAISPAEFRKSGMY